MPIYEYRCQKCEKVFEKYQKLDESGDSLKCPYCGEAKPEKILSSFSSSSSSCGNSTRFT